MQPSADVPVSIWRSSPDVTGIGAVGAHYHTNHAKIKFLEKSVNLLSKWVQNFTQNPISLFE
ncbi:hypothetical protein FD12_GL001033 [Lentilactobacillus rapi DSM 19907 = JCM 15042]|uniref:Uncharacterized protein n=1 Tax=Lentilactobacillus rapi DSM 19907 = JCM 15042 TaxID=1423795 RepID=A0ABR5PBG4_9LACO|nr:hypothetical protein FD12_GL001033 [Lentilactobacillus rapi DSM 19907 = JCM 15042]